MAEMLLSERVIQELISDANSRYAEVNQRVRIWRALVNRTQLAVTDSEVGTLIPPPWHESQLTFKAMSDAPMQATQHYVSRIAGNRPDFKVTPLSEKDELHVMVDKTAAKQERLNAELWEAMGGAEAQRACAWAQTTGGVGYLHVMPRDATFGLPDRIYIEDSDEAAMMAKLGKLSPSKRTTVHGKVMYAEPGDVWAARRKAAMRKNAEDGKSLFVLKAYPRDMVLRERDADGIKWACITEVIPAHSLAPGSPLAVSAAKRALTPPELQEQYGLFLNKNGAIDGGITTGEPPEGGTLGSTYSLVKFFNRTELIVMIVPGGSSVDGGKIVWRGNHGCMVRGVPAVPIVEVPFMRTDTDIPGMEFATPLSQVMAYVPLINQIESLRSNATAINLTPRWVVEMKDGTILRGEDGEPLLLSNETVPGLDPKEAAAYPGTLRQLTIETADSDELLKLYLEQLAMAMPAPAAQGQGGTSEAAWHAQLMIEQSHQNLEQPVDNQARGAEEVMLMCHGWLRQLDETLYFYPLANFKSDSRPLRALVEFDPEDLTDSILVNQEIADPQARLVWEQLGMEKRAQGLINDREYFESYAKVQDPRQAEIDMHVQAMKQLYLYGASDKIMPGSALHNAYLAAQGQITAQMIRQSQNFAIATAEQMAMQAQMASMVPQSQAPTGEQQSPAAPGGPPQQQPGNVPVEVGMRQPGMGMAPTLQGQLGSRAPGMAGVPV